MGSSEGEGAEPVARGFLAAMNDPRFPPIGGSERGDLAAQVSFVYDVRAVARDELPLRFEAGTHGIAAREPERPPVLILPDIARGLRLEGGRLEATLVHKNGGRPFSERASWFVFRGTRAVARPFAKPEERPATDASAAWLAGMIQRDGTIVYAVDARTTEGTRVGPMHHARIAVAIEALAKHGGFPDHVRRARRRLEADARAALCGRAVAGWPERPDHVAGTLALAVLAGAELRAPLRELANRPEVRASSWHAPQVAAALAGETPPELWEACKRRVLADPWAPWTAIAAHGLKDGATLARCIPALEASVAVTAPHAGGVRWPGGAGGAELALSAIVAHALGASRSAAAARAMRFVRAWQFRDATTPLTLEPRTAHGAFPSSPVASALRVDVTGHALRALLGR